MSDDKFDVIIVGAGPAGAACAYALAKAGKEVVLIERGASAGNKNFTGGRLYTHALELLEPGLYKEAVLERKVVREQIMMMSKDSAVTIDYNDYGMTSGEYPQSYTVLHAKFTEWLVGKAEEQGAMVVNGIRVDDIIEQDGKIVGVKAGDDNMYADLVIAADGVNSFIAEKAGLKPHITAHNVGIGIKELIELPSDVIEKRFCLAPDEGAARVVLGCTDGISGGGAIYTNKNSISLVCVYTYPEGGLKERRLADLYQDYKMHPTIMQLIEGGTTVEYGAHLVMEHGWKDVMKTPYRDGLLVIGEAAGYVINTGAIIRGIDLAIMTGVAASKAILSDKKGADLGREYSSKLDDIKLTETMKVLSKWPDFMASPRLFSAYPDAANDILRALFHVDGKVPKSLYKEMKKAVFGRASLTELAKDGWRAFKAL